MKKFLMVMCSLLCIHAGTRASEVQQPLTAAVSDDAELLFDEAPDALDAVTAKDCACSTEETSLQGRTMLQSCYQTALFCLLGSYLIVKKTYDNAVGFVMNHVPWTTSTTSKNL
jgi:hypothetical protein